jgi:hypothetical protein
MEADDACTHGQLGIALSEMSQWKEATLHYRRALAGDSALFQVHNNLGNVLHWQGEWEEAIPCYQRALALQPSYAEAHANLGVILHKMGNFEEALQCCRKAISARPDFAKAHENLGMMLLLLGEHEEGWKEHEWRWQSPEWARPWQELAAPRWNGEPIPGRKLWLIAEQGYGDVLQFIRYLPVTREQSGGARISMVCSPPLERVLNQCDFCQGDIVAHKGWSSKELCAEDRFLPLLSLPATLRQWEPLPMEKPYLHADASLRATWRERLGPKSAFQVGLAWAGRATHKDDRYRSIQFDKMKPLLQTPDVDFISLQVQPGREGPASPQTTGLIDLTAEICDFADTAALMAELDLIITVDTAVAHLAGALGRPVWTLLANVPEWRWGLEREDTPWYPTMRLFRQKTRGDWEEVIQRVAEELRQLSSGISL